MGAPQESIGAQFATLRRLCRYTAEDVAQKIGVTLSSIEGIERGQTAKGATLACYFSYTDMLKVTLRNVFMLALPDAMPDEIQSRLTKAQQVSEHALDRMPLEQVYRAMHQLEIHEQPITQQAVGEIVQMTPQGLKRYPSVRVVLEQLAEENRMQQQREAEVQLEQLIERVRVTVIQLRARGEPVTQRTIQGVCVAMEQKTPLNDIVYSDRTTNLGLMQRYCWQTLNVRRTHVATGAKRAKAEVRVRARGTSASQAATCSKLSAAATRKCISLVLR